MGIGAIAAGIFSVAKAIPAVRDIIIMVNQKFLDIKVARVESGAQEERKDIDEVMADLGRATTNEARREASKKLSAIINN